MTLESRFVETVRAAAPLDMPIPSSCICKEVTYAERKGKEAYENDGGVFRHFFSNLSYVGKYDPSHHAALLV